MSFTLNNLTVDSNNNKTDNVINFDGTIVGVPITSGIMRVDFIDSGAVIPGGGAMYQNSTLGSLTYLSGGIGQGGVVARIETVTTGNDPNGVFNIVNIGSNAPDGAFSSVGTITSIIIRYTDTTTLEIFPSPPEPEPEPCNKTKTKPKKCNKTKTKSKKCNKVAFNICQSRSHNLKAKNQLSRPHWTC